MLCDGKAPHPLQTALAGRTLSLFYTLALWLVPLWSVRNQQNGTSEIMRKELSVSLLAY